MWLKSLVPAALIALLSLPAVAQTAAPATAAAPSAPPMRIRGTIEKFDGNVLTVKTREGEDVTVRFADNFTVRGVKAIRLSHVKDSDFVGVAALTDANGKLHAQEVLVFPEAMRGTGEGHYPWDLSPGSSMTNATVAQVTKVSHGRVLHLQYKDGTTDIEVSPGTPIVTFVPGTPKLLKPGRAVLITARKSDDGTLTAPGVTVQRGKTKPPM